MSQLSKYIQKQLSSILNQIHETPPKKYPSMNKIKTLVNGAPISQQEKSCINKSIKRIENAMIKPHKQKTPMTQYSKNLFFQNMFLEQKCMNKQGQGKCGTEDNQIQYNKLLDKLRELRGTRLKRQEYLKQLILKSQRMQRMVSLRQENQQKYLKSKMIQEFVGEKKAEKEWFKKSVKEAVKNNNIKKVHNLVLKFQNNFTN